MVSKLVQSPFYGRLASDVRHKEIDDESSVVNMCPASKCNLKACWNRSFCLFKKGSGFWMTLWLLEQLKSFVKSKRSWKHCQKLIYFASLDLTYFSNIVFARASVGTVGIAFIRSEIRQQIVKPFANVFLSFQSHPWSLHTSGHKVFGDDVVKGLL